MHVLIRWNKSYSVNIKEIDQQHKKLIDIINTLNDSVNNQYTSDIIGPVISDLMDYAMVHFKYEEQYFQKISFENAAQHIAEHHSFCHKIEKYRNQYLEGNSVSLIEILIYLKYWFHNHVLKSDLKYADYINP
jgi:hemerythrin-like metal-binding domain